MRKNNFRYALIAVILVAILVALSVAFIFLPRKYTAFDMTSGHIYKISNTTKSFLSELDEDITIYVLNADTTQKKFEEYIERYADCSDRISVKYVNTEKDASVSEMLAEYGFSKVYPPTAYSLLICSDMRTQFLDFSNIFSYSNETLGFSEISSSYYNYYAQQFSSSAEYADYLDALLTDTQMNFHGETALTQLIEYVAADVIPQAYFITGHGEDSLTDGNFISLLNYYGYPYGVCDISEIEAVPNDASCIIINEPKEDYTEEQIEIILDYLRDGGNLFLALSPKASSMANLATLTEYYGFSVLDGVIAEDKTSETEASETARLDIIAATFNIDHDMFASLSAQNCNVTAASPIKISDDLRASQLVTPLLSSSDKAYIEGSELKAPYILGVAVEEEIDGKNTKIVCFTGAESFNSKENSVDALTLPVCAISWIDESFVSEVKDVAPTVYQDKYISVTQQKAIYLGIMFALVIPVGVVGVGIGSRVIRKKK